MISILGLGISYSTLSVIAVLIICILVGAWRGLLKTLFGMIAIILSLVATIFLSPQLYPVFAKMNTFVNMGAAGAKLATFVSTIVVSVGVYIILKVIFFFINRSLSNLPVIGVVNRVLGAVFSCAVGFFIISFVFYVFTLLSNIEFFGKIIADASKDVVGVHLTQHNVITQILNVLASKIPKIQEFVNAINSAFVSATIA